VGFRDFARHGAGDSRFGLGRGFFFRSLRVRACGRQSWSRAGDGKGVFSHKGGCESAEGHSLPSVVVGQEIYARKIPKLRRVSTRLPAPSHFRRLHLLACIHQLRNHVIHACVRRPARAASSDFAESGRCVFCICYVPTNTTFTTCPSRYRNSPPLRCIGQTVVGVSRYHLTSRL